MCFELFKIFLQIGAFTIGGGYAMLEMVERAIVRKKKWIENDEFWDMIAVVQAIPGVFALNTALYVGYKLKGVKGALCASLGAILPSFLMILCIALFFVQMKDNIYVEKIFKGLRPCVVALMLAPAIKMMKSAKLKLWTIWIPILSAVSVWKFGVSPVLIIIVTVLLGIFVGLNKGSK